MSFFDGPSGRIPYHFWPARRPLAGLIFLHGAGDSHRYHRLAMTLNERRVSVLATNGVGEAQRDAPPHLSSLDVPARAVEMLAERAARRLSGIPLVLGGHSLGGTAAALAVARNAGPYAGLVLSGTPLTRPRPRAARLPGGLVSMDLSYLPVVAGGASAPAAPVPVVTPRALEVAWQELAERFEQVRVPVLFVHGGKDSLVPITDNRSWAYRLPVAQLAWFPRAGHDVFNTPGPPRAATTVADFVLSAALSQAVA